MKFNPGWNFQNSYIKLPPIFYTWQEPTPVASPKLVIFNEPLAEELNLDNEALQTEEGIATFAGNHIPEGAEPIAQAYAGHQFGYFTMLGDGRAILLGEHVTSENQRFDIQLKGSGRTPIPAEEMVGRLLARCLGNTSSVKRCMPLESRRQEVWPLSRQGKRSCVSNIFQEPF